MNKSVNLRIGMKRLPYVNIFIFFENLKFLKIFKSKDGPFLWTKKDQGLILSTFFYGYIITQVY